MSGQPSQLACRFCGQVHADATPRRGRRASCVRCGALLVRSSFLGPEVTEASLVTGAILAIPALSQPLITVSSLGGKRDGYLLGGAQAMWDEGMRVLGVWIAICGVAAPLLLFGVLGALTWPRLVGHRADLLQRLRWIADALQFWGAAEVYFLAVLVALTKLGSLVRVAVGPGLWFYAAMALAALLAWRSYESEARSPGLATRVHLPRAPA